MWGGDFHYPYLLLTGLYWSRQGLRTRHDSGRTLAAFGGRVEFITYAKYNRRLGQALLASPGPLANTNPAEPRPTRPNDFWYSPGVPDGGFALGF